MKLRQKLWSWYFKALFSPKKIKVIWPKIKTEPTYRQIQSIEITNKTQTLSREELRALTLEAYGLEGDPKAVPDVEKSAIFLLQDALAEAGAERAAAAAEAAAEVAAEQAEQDTTPEQGVDAGIGKLSTGGDAKDSRDNKADRNTKNA
jgi:hypothetical protein